MITATVKMDGNLCFLPQAAKSPLLLEKCEFCKGWKYIFQSFAHDPFPRWALFHFDILISWAIAWVCCLSWYQFLLSDSHSSYLVPKFRLFLKDSGPTLATLVSQWIPIWYPYIQHNENRENIQKIITFTEFENFQDVVGYFEFSVELCRSIDSKYVVYYRYYNSFFHVYFLTRIEVYWILIFSIFQE